MSDHDHIEHDDHREIHAGRREYDPIVAAIIRNQGSFQSQIETLLNNVHSLSENQRKTDRLLHDHMVNEEHTINEIAANMPTRAQMQKLDELIASQQDWLEFWKDVRKSLLKKFIIAVTGLAGVALLWYLWNMGHGIAPHP